MPRTPQPHEKEEGKQLNPQNPTPTCSNLTRMAGRIAANRLRLQWNLKPNNELCCLAHGSTWCIGSLVYWLLLYWLLGVLVYWFVVLLVNCLLMCWFIGVLLVWFIGLLVYWFTVLLVYWFTCVLACWLISSLVCWFTGLLLCSKNA